MKKSLLFGIIIFVMLILVVSTLVFNFVYFRDFHKKVRLPNDAEKQRALEIFKEKTGYENQIKIGNVLPLKDTNLVQVEIVVNGSRERYLVDTINGGVVRK